MASKAFVKASIDVMQKAENGVRYSELTKVQQSAADRLANRGKIKFTPIAHGDWLVNRGR